MNRLLLFFPLMLVWITSCQSGTEEVFKSDLEDFPTLKSVLEDSTKFQVQIIYSEIDWNEHGNPLFTDYSFHLRDQEYFYPASTVKLPIVLLALEWLEEQNIAGLDLETTMLTDSVRPSQLPAFVDSTAQNGLPSIGHYIKKVLLVSDNDASNRLFEMMGMDYVNRKLKEKGLNQTVITQRLSFPISPEENRHFNPIKFVDKSGKTILELPARHTDSIYVVPGNPKIGEAFYRNDSLIQGGMDFSFKNKFSLSDLHGVLKRLIFPNSFFESERFQLNEQHREFVLKYMSMLPRESAYPSYDSKEYYDGYSKFFKFGASNDSIPSNFRIFNKTGWSYGFLIDGSYFVDFENGIDFLVSAVIYVNEDKILNDDNYETEEIGKPFFAELGEYLYQRELKRKRGLRSDLNKFKFDYSANQ